MWLETWTEWQHTADCTIRPQQLSRHVVKLENRFLHQVAADCRGRLTSGSGDVVFRQSSVLYQVQPYEWARSATVPSATKNLFWLTIQPFELRNASIEWLRSGKDQIQVDVTARSVGFPGTVSASARFDVTAQ